MNKNFLIVFAGVIVIAMIYSVFTGGMNMVLPVVFTILTVGIAICTAIEESLGSFDIHVHNGGIESVEVDKE